VNVPMRREWVPPSGTYGRVDNSAPIRGCVAAQLASRESASALVDPGCAGYKRRVRPPSAEMSRASNTRSMYDWVPHALLLLKC
jgi:hypothetical protein